MKKITRNNINKENLVVLGYCQIQIALNRFASNYKVGCNSGIYGWNYDLYRVEDVDIITGYNCPYRSSNKEIEEKLIAFENKLRKLSFSELYEKEEELKKEFLSIFKRG